MLQTLLAVPAGNGTSAHAESIASWQAYFDQLAATGRAGTAEVHTNPATRFWISAERAQAFEVLHPEASWLHRPASVAGSESFIHSDAVFAIINGWMSHSGPVTAGQLAEKLALPINDVEQALLRLEANGTILRGQFDVATAPALEWCERRLLARIHRLTIGRLRKEIEPVTPAEFMRWLLRWQHLAPGTQTTGERGTLEVLEQLQGFEVPANAWEPQVLARRVRNYDPKILDQLCLTGAVGWGRLSAHPAAVSNGNQPSLTGNRNRRVIPTSVAPVTFFVRERAEWMPTTPVVATPAGALSPGAREVFGFLQQHGASFFADVVRGTAKLKAEVETALWELVAIGLVTADGFDNLRALIDPKRRAGQGHGRSTRPRHSVGRRSLLYSHLPAQAAAPDSHRADAAEARARSIESTCWMLLQRYGIVFRELLARESVAPKWRELLLALRRLEDRGEIRGGRFVSAFLGEQFALPIALESLRAERKRLPSGETIIVSTADPLNLVGVIVPGERVPAISGKLVAFRDGVAVETPARPMMPMSVAVS